MNAVEIQEVLKELQKVVPATIEGTIPSWEYPGYISVVVDGVTYNLGEHTGAPTGYNWNDEDCTVSGEIADLNTAAGVARVFLSQVRKAHG